MNVTEQKGKERHPIVNMKRECCNQMSQTDNSQYVTNKQTKTKTKSNGCHKQTRVNMSQTNENKNKKNKIKWMSQTENSQYEEGGNCQSATSHPSEPLQR